VAFLLEIMMAAVSGSDSVSSAGLLEPAQGEAERQGVDDQGRSYTWIKDGFLICGGAVLTLAGLAFTAGLAYIIFVDDTIDPQQLHDAIEATTPQG